MDKGAIMSRSIQLVIFIGIYYILYPNSAHAYLDPGTGSFVIQIIIGFFVGGLYFLKTYWHKIIVFFKNVFHKKDKSKKDDKNV